MGEPFLRRSFGGGGGGGRFPVTMCGSGGRDCSIAGGDFIVGGVFIPPRLTFANRDLRSFIPFLTVGDDCCVASDVVGSVVSVGAGRNLFATA